MNLANNEKIYSKPLTIFLRNLMGKIGLNFHLAPTPGFSIFGFTIFKDIRTGDIKPRGYYALLEVSKLDVRKILDVGSGSGWHAQHLKNQGYDVECVDFGTSFYAQEKNSDDIVVHKIDFLKFEPKIKYDLIWASHVLEHQRNVGLFLEKCVSCANDGGYLVITVPDQHRKLVGGHLTHWSPGLLIYNCVLSGLNMRYSSMIRGSNEWSIIVRIKKIYMPDNLTFDKGDIRILKEFLPDYFFEGIDLFYEK